MFDHDDLKWLAAQATELNTLLQQVCRYSDEARRHAGEARYLALLNTRVELAARKSQELFDRVTSRILTGVGNGTPAFAEPVNRIAGIGAAPRTGVFVKIPLGEIGSSSQTGEQSSGQDNKQAQPAESANSSQSAKSPTYETA